jgi:hypothetical protein
LLQEEAVSMNTIIAAASVALSLLACAVPARAAASTGEQAKAPGDARPLAGEWRSGEQFEGQARATLVVADDAGSLTGLLTVFGLTRGDDDRATLRVPFRDGVWDGASLSFETSMPDGDEKARWTLRVTAPGKAILEPVENDGRQIEGGPKWEMSRR